MVRMFGSRICNRIFGAGLHGQMQGRPERKPHGAACMILFVTVFGSGIIAQTEYQEGAPMKLTLIVAILAIAAGPACALAQAPNPPKSSKPAKAAPAAKETKVAAAQKVVKTISSDKAKTAIYCDIGKLGDQIEEAEQKKDMNKIDELNRKMNELATKLGPEYVALMGDLEEIDPSSQDSQDITLALAGLDKLCAK